MPRVETKHCPPEKAVEIILDGSLRAFVWPGYARVEVPSDSEPGTMHDVVVRTGMTICSCPGFRYRNRCRHATRVSGVLSVPKDADEARMNMLGDFLALLGKEDQS